MDRAEIESLVSRWATDGVAEGRLEVFDELLDEGVVDLSGGGGGAIEGRDSFKLRARAVQGALSNRTVTVDALVIEADRVAWRWSLRGVHAGVFLDVAPTGKSVVLSGVNFQRVRDGRVVEHWTLGDLASLARQLRGGP
jgi:predicted ester cyclase